MKEITLFGVNVNKNDKVLVSRAELEKIKLICDTLSKDQLDKLTQDQFENIIKENGLNEAEIQIFVTLLYKKMM